MIAVAAFIIALLLAVAALGPTGGWLVALTVLAGIETFRPRRSLGRLFRGGWPDILALSAFIIALLLTIGTIETTDAWLIALAVLTAIQAFRPRWSGRWSRFRPSRRTFGRRRRAWAASSWNDDAWDSEDDW